jgi:aryl-alcohol dehydrogenase-like predicted oxidoreductase
MDHRLLGRTGVRVSPLCLGAMNFGGGTAEADAVRMVHAALDAGINFVDTADVYNAGDSERIVGKALAGRRDKVVLATKVHGRTGLGPNDQGNSRLHVLRAERYGLAILPWAPLAQGVLAGRYPADGPWPADSRAVRQPGQANIYADRVTPRGIEVGRAFTGLARSHGRTPGQLALLWCKDQAGITAPIVGPRTEEQLTELLPVLDWSLSADERFACDALVPPGGVVTNFHNTAPWMKTPIP